MADLCGTAWFTKQVARSIQILHYACMTLPDYFPVVIHISTCFYTGLDFWKCPRRKLYAVASKGKKRKSTIVVSSSDDDSDFIRKISPLHTKSFLRLVFAGNKQKRKKNNTLQDIMTDLTSMKDLLQNVLSLSEGAKIPISLKKLFTDTFKCTICASVPIKPPVIITKCCKSILGCESCVNAWYSGPEAPTKTCPKCRAERGYTETLLLQGLDDLLVGIGTIMDPDNNLTA